MAIFDCFQYFNEEHIADLRFNVLNEFVKTFVIVESTVNHQGKPKKLHFDIEKYKKFWANSFNFKGKSTREDFWYAYVAQNILVLISEFSTST